LDSDLLVISSEDPAYPFGRSRLAPLFDVTFDLGNPCEIRGIRMVFQGNLLAESWNVNFHGKQACWMQLDETDPHGGTYCLKVRGTAGEHVDVILSEHIPVSSAPLKLRAVIWARGKGAFHAGLYAYGHRL
jgi:hypothetical protein